MIARSTRCEPKFRPQAVLCTALVKIRTASQSSLAKEMAVALRLHTSWRSKLRMWRTPSFSGKSWCGPSAVLSLDAPKPYRRFTTRRIRTLACPPSPRYVQTFGRLITTNRCQLDAVYLQRNISSFRGFSFYLKVDIASNHEALRGTFALSWSFYLSRKAPLQKLWTHYLNF